MASGSLKGCSLNVLAISFFEFTSFLFYVLWSWMLREAISGAHGLSNRMASPPSMWCVVENGAWMLDLFEVQDKQVAIMRGHRMQLSCDTSHMAMSLEKLLKGFGGATLHLKSHNYLKRIVRKFLIKSSLLQLFVSLIYSSFGFWAISGACLVLNPGTVLRAYSWQASEGLYGVLEIRAGPALFKTSP